MRWAAVILVLLVGCSDSTGDLNPAWVQMVDSRAAQRDCQGLQQAFNNSNDPDELRYVDSKLEDAGCY